MVASPTLPPPRLGGHFLANEVSLAELAERVLATWGDMEED